MTLIHADQVVTPDLVLAPGWIDVVRDRLAAVGEGQPPRPPDEALPGRTVVPGFVDVHVHGGAGASYSSMDPDQVAAGVAFHREQGTATVVASLVTAPLDELERSLALLADLVEGDLLAGIHLEGPFLSPARCGVHPRSLLRPPDPAVLSRLLSAARGTVRMVTLAPELRGGLDAVRQVVGAGAVAAIGHTDGTYDLTRAAIRAGARHATHLLNGMRPVHHREPGPIVALLEDPGVTLELIADGVHLHPAVIRTVVGGRATRVALVSDATAAAGLGDGHHRLAGRSVYVRDGVARVPGDGSLAGTTLTMPRALRHVVEDAGVPLTQAVAMASTTPARALGLSDVGRLEPGCRADLVVLDERLDVTGVMVRGAWVRKPLMTPAEAGGAGRSHPTQGSGTLTPPAERGP